MRKKEVGAGWLLRVEGMPSGRLVSSVFSDATTHIQHSATAQLKMQPAKHAPLVADVLCISSLEAG